MTTDDPKPVARRLWFASCAIVSGAVLFLFGNWCLASTNIPAPELALRLPPRLLAGLGFILVNPFSLIPITLILTVSRFLLPRLRRVSFMAVAVVGIAFVLVGAFWVPNPIALWPISIMGNERTFPNLIGELFTFHIIPAPKISYDSTAAFESLFRWQIMECGARFCIVIAGWTACLAAIWVIGRRPRIANK